MIAEIQCKDLFILRSISLRARFRKLLVESIDKYTIRITGDKDKINMCVVGTDEKVSLRYVD